MQREVKRRVYKEKKKVKDIYLTGACKYISLNYVQNITYVVDIYAEFNQKLRLTIKIRKDCLITLMCICN